jgi:hypothetical protein
MQNLVRAIAVISNMHVPTLSLAAERLERIGTTIEAIRIIQELNPDRLIGEDVRIFDSDSLIQAAVDVINNHAPVDMDFIVESFFESDGEGMIGLVPRSMGFDGDYDSVSEVLNDLEGHAAVWDMFVFFHALNEGDEDLLMRASMAYDWGIDEYPDLGAVDHYDRQKISKQFAQAGLQCFDHAIDVCYQETGNIYFDYSLFEEDAWNLPDFTVAGVRSLIDEYHDAQPIGEDYIRAHAIFQEPGIPEQILKIFLSSAERKNKRVRARTLAEVFADEADEGED